MYAKRIFWKLYPSYLIVTLLALSAVYVISSTAISRFFEQQAEKNLNEQAALLRVQMTDPMAMRDMDTLGQLVDMLSPNLSARVTLILPDGTVAGDSDKDRANMGNHRNRPEIQEALLGRVGRSLRYSNTLKKNMMYVAIPVSHSGQVIGVIRTAMPLTKIDQLIDAVQHRIILGGLIILFVAALLSLLVSRQISRPLERIKEGAKQFAEGNFSYRLQVLGSAETTSLAETMNQMAAQLEERLQTVIKEKNQREAVLSSMVEGVLAVDTDGHIISLNKAAAQFFQVVHPEDAAGRSLEEVFRNVHLQRFIGSVLKSQDTLECELTVEHDQTHHLQARGTNLLGLQGARIGAVVVINDVSRLYRLENLRSDFVANVSHELKTPITSIKGFIETLLDGAKDDPKEAQRFLKIVAKHADRLNAIIDDLLTLSRLEKDQEHAMTFQRVPLAGILHSAAEVCSHRAGKKNISIQVESAENLIVNVNQPLMEQALINLIGNAVKYSKEGKTVTVRAEQDRNGIRLTVTDQGYGIAPEHLERLFERFYRVDKGRSRQEGGTGLGLAIVKHIAQAHGGTVSVESTFGKGSTFTINLP